MRDVIARNRIVRKLLPGFKEGTPWAANGYGGRWACGIFRLPAPTLFCRLRGKQGYGAAHGLAWLNQHYLQK
jgi:hypothetical protein